jgi:hypothetical protein
VNHATFRLSQRLLYMGVAALKLGALAYYAPAVLAQDSVGRGRAMADGAAWVGAGVPN